MTEHRPLTVTNLAGFIAAAVGNGVQWTLAEPSQLNANLVHLEPGASIDEHVTNDVDVLVVVIAGTGTLGGGDRPISLATHDLAHLGEGASRSLRAGDTGLTYLTVHRARGPIQLRKRR